MKKLNELKGLYNCHTLIDLLVTMNIELDRANRDGYHVDAANIEREFSSLAHELGVHIEELYSQNSY